MADASSGRRVARRRSWVTVAIVALGVPLLAYLGLLLVLSIGLSSGY